MAKHFPFSGMHGVRSLRQVDRPRKLPKLQKTKQQLRRHGRKKAWMARLMLPSLVRVIHVGIRATGRITEGRV